jgi:hypothetical protein
VLFQTPVRGAKESLSPLFESAAGASKSFALVNASVFINLDRSCDACK